MERRNYFLKFSLLLLLAISLGACNLGTAREAAPPTLQALPSATPPPTLGVEISGDPQQPGIILAQTPIADPSIEINNLLNQVDAERMRAHIAFLQSVHTRHILSSTTEAGYGIGAAERYIAEQFQLISQSSGGNLQQPIEHAFTAYNTASESAINYNVFSVISGTETNAGIYIIGAHYDSVNTNLKDPTAYAPGANDNGSGVAALLEIARILSQRRYRATLIFVAFSGEEHDRQGSKAFVDYLSQGNMLSEVRGMINIDTIGNNDDGKGNIDDTSLRVFSDESNVSKARQMARMAEIVGDIYGLDMRLLVETRRDREGRYGDHFSFNDAGTPAIRFINTMEQWPNGSPNDLIQYIEFDYLERATKSIMMFILTQADGPRLRRCDIVLRDLGNGNQSLLWDPVETANGYMVFLRFADSLRYDAYFTTEASSVDSWDGFQQFGTITVAARGNNGIVGPFCDEYAVSSQIASSP
ncbi:MAG: M20/M25/M40 family metallo-hydrolase [Anaerolineaceae bacterium]|nr:M20/M25/M40 family metallo-hydrolase [Anaerolineaceae bacterium]